MNILVFLLFFYKISKGKDYENHDISNISDQTLNDIEADIYWTFSYLMNDIQVFQIIFKL